MIPKEYIEKVVAAPENSIVEYISGQIELKKRGKIYSGKCPFCKSGSICVYPETNSFYCFTCGTSGDIINYVRKIGEIGYVDAIKNLQNMQKYHFHQILLKMPQMR